MNLTIPYRDTNFPRLSARGKPQGVKINGNFDEAVTIPMLFQSNSLEYDTKPVKNVQNVITSGTNRNLKLQFFFLLC